MLKKFVFLSAIIFIGLVNALIYWNTHLFYRAKKTGNDEKKIEILERTVSSGFADDRIFYELGKVYFDLGIRSLNKQELSDMYLRRSIKNFRHSVRMNPASEFAHFYLAQSLLYLSTLSSPSEIDPNEEFRKATLLTGFNSQIFFEVGKLFLSRWGELSEKDKEFSTGILKKIMEEKDRQKIFSIMQIWEMSIKDYDVIEKFLPRHPKIYRDYADFLGEKSLSLEKRQSFLASAEFMDYQRAKREHSLGESELLYYRFKKASIQFKSCLNRLENINFYQEIAQQNLIDETDFIELQKSALLNLIKCHFENGGEFKKVKNHLLRYLDLEDKEAVISELESYLQNRGILKEKIEINGKELDLLLIHLHFYFKLNRYTENIRVRHLLEQSHGIVPERSEKDYVKVLQIIGDSYQKGGYFYDAEELYQKALEIDPKNFEILLRIRKIYQRRDEYEMMRDIEEKIDRILSPKERIFENLLIDKGRRFSHKLILDGQKIITEFLFEDNWGEISPLITVVFNGRIVWEDYLKEETLSLSLESKIGNNLLEIVAVNRPVSLVKLTYR